MMLTPYTGKAVQDDLFMGLCGLLVGVYNADEQNGARTSTLRENSAIFAIVKLVSQCMCFISPAPSLVGWGTLSYVRQFILTPGGMNGPNCAAASCSTSTVQMFLFNRSSGKSVCSTLEDRSKHAGYVVPFDSLQNGLTFLTERQTCHSKPQL